MSEVAQIGHELYRTIQNVMCMTHVRRQSGVFRDILLRLRDGKTTEDDWHTLNQNCSLDYMDDERKCRFESNETFYIFSTNEECNRKNELKMNELQQPILKIEASHDAASSKRISSELFRKLQPTLFLCVGARVMLLWNLGQSCGLVNGYIGTVIEIYEDFLVIEFPSYAGRPFFEGVGKEKYVPIFKETLSVTLSDGVHHRTQYPLLLSWAITVWKAQGMTCEGTVFAQMTVTERSAGLTYVMFSRVTIMSNLCYGNSIPKDRLDNIGNGKGIRKRLQEEDRLKELAIETERFYQI